MHFFLDTDASNFAFGGELCQVRRGVSEPSGLSVPAEQRRYCTTREKSLAVVRFSRQFRHNLLGRKLNVRTDYHSLTWLINFRHPKGQIARWLEEQGQYDMTVIHRPGKKHLNADALSLEMSFSHEGPCA